MAGERLNAAQRNWKEIMVRTERYVLAISIALLMSYVFGYDQFDVQVCDAQSGDREKISCYEKLEPLKCQSGSSQDRLKCYKDLTKKEEAIQNSSKIDQLNKTKENTIRGAPLANEFQKSVKPSFDVQLDVHVKESEDGAMLYGETNLPDGTKLGAQVEGSDYRAQDFKIYVKDGVYSSSTFTDSGAPLSGVYNISVFAYFTKIWQVDRVLQELKKYSGPSTKNGRLEVKRRVGLGKNLSDKAIQIVEQHRIEKITEDQAIENIRKSAYELYRQGMNMERFRNNKEKRQCMKIMWRLQPKVKELEVMLKSLPREQNTIYLGMATSVLHLCVSCSERLASESCVEAEQYLQEIK